MADDADNQCTMCGVVKRQYVVLNRVCVVSGTSGSMITGPTSYRWVPRTGECSGHVLCLACISLWCEGQALAVDIRSQRRGVE